MKKTWTLVLFLIILCGGAGTASAASLSGTVESVDRGSGSFRMKWTNPGTLSTESVEITVTPETRFEKISAFKDLKAGDMVSVEADPGESYGRYLARSLLLTIAGRETIAPRDYRTNSRGD